MIKMMCQWSVRSWHKAGEYCSAAFLPLLNELQTETGEGPGTAAYGTLQQRTHATLCPQPAKADMLLQRIRWPTDRICSSMNDAAQE
jgi:hypothetical protein